MEIWYLTPPERATTETNWSFENGFSLLRVKTEPWNSAMMAALGDGALECTYSMTDHHWLLQSPIRRFREDQPVVSMQMIMLSERGQVPATGVWL